MRSSEADPVEWPTVRELEEALGKALRRCELVVKNWRNRIYRIELADGNVVFGKQVVMGTDAMVQCQYEQLRALRTLQIPRLRVPKALAVLPLNRLLLVEFVPGPTIETLVWTSKDVIPACELAGKILAQLELARAESTGRMPIEAINRDLATAPWRLSFYEKRLLRIALDRLAAAEVRIGEVYRDYKPANLIFKNNDLLFFFDLP